MSSLSPLTVWPYKRDGVSAWREALGSARGAGSQGRPGRERRWSWLKEVQLGLKLTWVPSLCPLGHPLPSPGTVSTHADGSPSYSRGTYPGSRGATPSVPHHTGASAGTHHLGIRMRLVAPRRQQMPGTAATARLSHSRSSERKLTA